MSFAGAIMSVSTPETRVDDAWAELNTAVRSLRDLDDETVVANAGLLALLHQLAYAQSCLTRAPQPTGAAPLA